MGRHSKPLFDKPKGKQIEHYVNGKDNTDGMHPGIRKKCPICNPEKAQEIVILFNRHI